MPADVRRRWDERGGVREVMRPSNKCNGMTYDADLNLIVCEHATSSLVRERPDGRREVLASHFEGYELNSPNDVVRAVRRLDLLLRSLVRPHAGLRRGAAARSSASRASTACRRAAARRELLVDRDMFDQPNGLCFSPDEQQLYVNDTVQATDPRVRRLPDGTLDERARVRQRPGVGARARRAGRHEVRFARQRLGARGRAASGSMRPTGELLGKVRMPEMVANLAWGGPDFQTLFVCATHSVYTVKTKVGPRLRALHAPAHGQRRRAARP